MTLTFTQEQRFLWPATLVLSQGREERPIESILERLRPLFRMISLFEDERPSPDLLKSPARPEAVTKWLQQVWNRLRASQRSQLVECRKTLRDEILSSALPATDQATLVTALDYLYRLSSARITARAGQGAGRAKIPFTRSRSMQDAYLKLAQFAATDLPVWLCGERGTEVERLAALFHELRGLPKEAFHTLEYDGSRPSDMAALQERLGADTTLFLPRIDECPKSFQEQLYETLTFALRTHLPLGLVVSSGPIDPWEKPIAEIAPELFAFLGPGMISLPPLRNRIEDLEALISFSATSQGLQDPIARFSPKALKILRHYHWPGNIEELELTVLMLLRKRPAGKIVPEDLPDETRPYERASQNLLESLKEIAAQERFRVLHSEEGRQRLARFLSERAGSTFQPSDAQRVLNLGRETTTRLLHALKSRGVIDGITGAGGKRITRYRPVEPMQTKETNRSMPAESAEKANLEK